MLYEMNLTERLLSAERSASRWDEQEHSQPLLDCKGAVREAGALRGPSPLVLLSPDNRRGEVGGCAGVHLRRSDLIRFPHLAGLCPPEVPRGWGRACV